MKKLYNTIDLDFTITIFKCKDETEYTSPTKIEIENLTNYDFKNKLYFN